MRSGYVAAQILPHLDYRGLERLRDQSIALCGHSDFTTIQLALFAKSGVKSFGGPMLSADFGAETPSAFTMTQFWSTLSQPSTTIVSDVPQQQCANISGTLWGGNLAILASLAGNALHAAHRGWASCVHRGCQRTAVSHRAGLYLHAAFLRPAGWPAGARPRASSPACAAFDYDYNMQAVIEQVPEVVGIPVIMGLQFGHVPDMVSLPVGSQTQLIANEHGFRLTVSDYPTLAG